MTPKNNLTTNSRNYVRRFIEFSKQVFLCLFACCAFAAIAQAQGETFGAFLGDVREQNGGPIEGAKVEVKYLTNDFLRTRSTDSNGSFFVNNLSPGDYVITISHPDFITENVPEIVMAKTRGNVIPVPVRMRRLTAIAQSPTPSPGTPQPIASSTPPATQSQSQISAPDRIKAEINTSDARLGGSFPNDQVSTLPLGGVTLTRSFDELALLLPGVAPPPETVGGRGSGPGVGPGVGTSGQFSVNGIRSRANNFTVDGSDNNDEDIGVRRQGFFALVPQPIESIQEFQITTLLSPAQYGRNIGAQVNAVSKSGTSQTHGTIYGFFNPSQLNAREFFDTTNGNGVSPLMVGTQPVLLDGRPKTVQNQSGGKDSSNLIQGGLTLGGPLTHKSSSKPGSGMFYFVSAEGQTLTAVKEESFAVPTVAQRGLFGSGATGLIATPFADINKKPGVGVGSPGRFSPTSAAGDAIFSYFPFPNNPGGVYGANTYTSTLPASAGGTILSGKLDRYFKVGEKQQSFTARYNFTDDWRIIPSTGGAIFSTIRPEVRTQNLSTFLNSELSGAGSGAAVFNYLRFSLGRTRLNFEDVPDATGFRLPSAFGDPGNSEDLPAFANSAEARFLLRSNLIQNQTLPAINFTANTGPISYVSNNNSTTESLSNSFGPMGEVIIAGFSPVGVDVFNFPQRRVNNTYQVADTLMMHRGSHNFAVGADIRRTALDSELPRNSRPLITVQGAPKATGVVDMVTRDKDNKITGVTFRDVQLGGGFTSAIDLAAVGAISGFFQTLSTTGTSKIRLRYSQLNFFGQDEWRWRPNISISYGLRYEYNTPPHEVDKIIENTFNSQLILKLVPGMSKFIDNRTDIFDPDRNNFAPRISFAYVPRPGAERTTVIRAGYGLFYDQIIGAVVSQSRNVFPNFLTVNFAGAGDWAGATTNPTFFQNHLSHPFCPCVFRNLSVLGAIGSDVIKSPDVTTAIANIESATGRGASTFGATLPSRHLEMPMAHQFSLTIDRELTRNIVVSAAYVGTIGRDLLRFTTPNLGPNELILPLGIDAAATTPDIWGMRLTPGIQLGPNGAVLDSNQQRPTKDVGVINIFKTTAKSRYDALQAQLRGRLRSKVSGQYQFSYTFSRSNDDASDVFDLAGSPALPQNTNLSGEYGPSNFDARHRLAYDYILDLPNPVSHAAKAVFGNIQLAGTGQFQTGQPFTVNSINDVNLDGNLTDRLKSTNGIVATGDRSQPFLLTVPASTLIAPLGQDGQVARNSFRGTNLFLNNLAVIKTIQFSESYHLIFRTEVFNIFNRANFGIPVRFLENPGFGKSTYTVTPGRRIQFALKLNF